MSTRSVKIADIRIDLGTQTRASICEQTVADYAERMLAGDKFPAAVIFNDGNQFIMSSGFHRLLASQRAGFVDLLCEVRQGTLLDALAYSLEANNSNGLKRTNADKKFSVEIALNKFADWTDRYIATKVGVSHTFVSSVRGQLATVANSPTRKGADGKQYKVPTPKPSMPTPTQAKAMMANVEPEPTTAQPRPVAAKDATTQAPVAPSYSLKSFYAEAEGLAEIVLAEFNVTDLSHAAGHFEMLSARIKRAVRERKSA